MKTADDFMELLAYFSDPERAKRIDPRRAVYLSEENIRRLAADERFMKVWRDPDQ